MTLATKPSSIAFSVGHSKVGLPVDQPTQIKSLSVVQVETNGTAYTALLDVTTNAAYTVPGATNFQIYGFEDFVIALTTGGSGVTLLQFGYSDDGAGTNFVLLVDVLGYVGSLFNALTTGTIINGFPTPNVTVPTGKIPTIKCTGTSATGKLAWTVLGIQTI